MIEYSIEWTRFYLVIITQTIMATFFFYIAFRILKRKFDRKTLTLSAIYIFPGISFIFNIIYIILFALNEITLGLILYYFTVYFVLFGFIFLLIFIINLLDIQKKLALKKQLIIVFIYATAVFLLLILPGGIKIDESTNWTPIYSWYFLIAVYIFFTSVIFIPTMIFSIKFFNTLNDKVLKKKFMYFFIGMIGMFFILYGATLYNTWDNNIYKIIWTILINIILIPSGFLLYFGIVRNL
ncbi:MAG: hypothetical protein ACFFAH_03900 [Promethearchaeota archaeon]